MTDSDQVDTGTVHWFWDLLKFALLLAGIALGYTYTPDVIRGIPFVQVFPALAAGGFGILIGDIIRMLWVSHRGPNSISEEIELGFATATVVVLFALVASPFAKAWMRVKRSVK